MEEGRATLRTRAAWGPAHGAQPIGHSPEAPGYRTGPGSFGWHVCELAGGSCMEKINFGNVDSGRPGGRSGRSPRRWHFGAFLAPPRRCPPPALLAVLPPPRPANLVCADSIRRLMYCFKRVWTLPGMTMSGSASSGAAAAARAVRPARCATPETAPRSRSAAVVVCPQSMIYPHPPLRCCECTRHRESITGTSSSSRRCTARPRTHNRLTTRTSIHCPPCLLATVTGHQRVLRFTAI